MTNFESAATPPPPRRGHFWLNGRDIEARPLPPGLYLVATPIGHLGDVTLRALETLAAADVVACEDTRVTLRLFARYGIATPLTAYHDHNAVEVRPKILARLDAGAAVALVSDAGTPLVSDPGFKLVRAAQEAGHNVSAVPGASAVLAALAVTGLPTDRFFFEGFLPARETARRVACRRTRRLSPPPWCSSKAGRGSPTCSVTSSEHFGGACGRGVPRTDQAP